MIMPVTEPAAPPSFDFKIGRLRDGTLVRIRRAQSCDRERVLQFVGRLSSDSLALRYLDAVRPDAAAAEILLPYLPGERLSLLLEADVPRPGTVIAHGEYSRDRADAARAEVAFLVEDDRQGLGAATLLLLHLARHARSAGVRRFDAISLPENRAMIDVFVGAGFPCSVTLRDGLEQVALDISREPATEILPYPADRRAGQFA
jgi:acetate---CoA ligase (ADP-forming)